MPPKPGAAVLAALFLAALALRLSSLTDVAEIDLFNLSAIRSEQQATVDAAILQLNTANRAAGERTGGFLALTRGDTAAADRHFSAALTGGADRVDLLRVARNSAEPLARLAESIYPQSATAAAWMGDALAPVYPEDPRTLAQYQRAAALAPGDNLLWEQVGIYARRQGHTDIALAAFANACELQPARNAACYDAARLAYGAGLWQAAIHYFELGGLPGSVDDWVLLIRAAQKLGWQDAADRYLQISAERYPADYQSLLRNQP